MSEVVKKKSTEKKLNKGILKTNNSDSKNNINKKENKSLSIKTKKIVHNYLQSNKNKLRKRNEGEIPFNLVFKSGKFMNDQKILSRFLSFFNIRELFIIMELDSHIHQAVIDSEVFKKYLLIRKDFVHKENKEHIKITKLKHLPLQNNDNDIISNLTSFGKHEKHLNNKETNDDITEHVIKKIHFKLPMIDFKKLKLKYFINNNCQVIKKYIKTYSLNNTESNCIFNGIMEYLIIKENGIPNENKNPIRFSLHNNRLFNYFNFFIDSLINLNYSQIIKLDLSNVGISSINNIKKLCHIFERYSSSLRILCLSNNNIDDKSAKLLFSGLQNNNNLEILNLSYNEIGEDGLDTNFFNINKSLHTLSLHHNLLGPNGADYLFNYLISNKFIHLKSLEIGYNGITKEGTEYMSKYIKNNEKLITFNIEGNYLCNEGIKIICESISQNKNRNYISFLDIHNNNITNKGCDYISKLLSESPFINNISLKNNILERDGLNKIISTLSSEDSNLISLDLSDTKLDDKAMKIISEKINKDITLQKLILSYNNFKSAGNHINNLLIKETNLKYLDLSFCDISSQFNLIFQGLAKNQNLKLINFSGNYIPMKKEILIDLGKVLSDNINLINLVLNECNIDDIGMNYINNNLGKNHSLQTLSLNHNFITKKSISGLENSIQKSMVIKHVYLYENNDLNIKLINQIENALKNNNRVYIENENDVK